MKKIFRFLFYLLILNFAPICFVQLSLCAEDENRPFYYANKQKIHLTKSSDKLLIRFKQGIGKDQIDQMAAGHRLTKSSFPRGVDVEENLCLFRTEELLSEKEFNELRASLKKRADVEVIAPIFMMRDSKVPVLITDEFIVQFKPNVKENSIDELNSKSDVHVVRKSPYVKNQYLLRIGKDSPFDALTISNVYYENQLTEWAHPNFISIKTELASVDDPLFGEQWHLHNTGQGGGTIDADVDAPEAWDITFGSPDIRISIQDDAVQRNHEDLSPNYVGGYDFKTHDPNPSPVTADENHGTAVAGVAVARGNNNKGVASSAPYCSLLGVRYGRYLQDDVDMFYWSNDNGAAVISNSWSYTSEVVPDAVRTAIDYVATSGRGGKGCVVLFAAGNGNKLIESTSCAAMENVIAVGASTNKDLRAGYSNYGSYLDIVAPSSGGTLRITTTDRTGIKGYNDGDYTNAYDSTGFGGTSSSAPLTAGVCALMLSVNAELTRNEVQQILQDTADKIGPRPYVDGRNDYYGYGRVNAHQALIALDDIPPAVVGDLSGYWVDLTTLRLTWTAPGDDGSVGTATSYDIRYYEQPITEANWDMATQVEGEPAPQAAGTPESMDIIDPPWEEAKYFALKTSDDNNNISALSNVFEVPILDTDGDGLPDQWEITYFGDLTHSAEEDYDDDGLTNLDEYNYGTNPTNSDTDDDGQSDGNEVVTGTDPLDPSSVFKLTSVGVYFPAGEPELWVIWTSVEGKSYQPYYSDSEFGDSMVWSPLDDALAGTGGTIGVVDMGDVGTGRKSPFDPTVEERYYRVEVAGTGVYTEDTGGIYWVTLRNSIFSGMNFVSTPLIPDGNTLDEVLNIQLTGSGVPQFADQCWKWNQSTLSYERAFFNGAVWRDYYNPSDPPTFTFDADNGYRLVLSPSTPDNTKIYFVGKVSTTSRNISLTRNEYSGMNEVASAYPMDVSLDNSGLIESGFEGSAFYPYSDQLWFWNWETLSYDRIYYNTTTAEWRNKDESPATRELAPGEGFRIILSHISGFSTWTYPKPYTHPPNN